METASELEDDRKLCSCLMAPWHSYCTVACNMQRATLIVNHFFSRSGANVRGTYDGAISCSFYPPQKMMLQRATCPFSFCHVGTRDHNAPNFGSVECSAFVSSR